MRKPITALVLAAHLASFFPAPARADYPTQDIPSQVGYQQSRVPKNRRVMVVIPSRWAIITGPVMELGVELNGAYHVIDALRTQGCDVHVYNSRLFEAYQYGSKLWREAGDYYALAIILQPGGNHASGERYVNADSTNVQILAVGGMRSNGVNHWATDSTVRGYVDDTYGSHLAASSTMRAGLIPWTPTGLSTDTLWGNNQTTGRRCTDARMASTHTGITAVIRVLHPFVTSDATGYYWGTSTSGLDSTGAKMPGADNATPNIAGTPDSIVREREIMGPIWKVRYANGRDTWFYKINRSGAANSYNPLMLYAICARFLDVKPIKYALDWDDVTDVNDSNMYPRWRNTAAESALAALTRVGVQPMNGINPGNFPGYVTGTNPLTETQPYASGSVANVPWSGPAHGFLKKLVPFYHSHDSTNGSITSGLVGGYGGYNPTNGSLPSVVGNQQSGRRYASRWNPGANEGNFMGAGGNFGIVQRIAYADSVWRSYVPTGERPPYMAFPANQMLPINWRVRRGTIDWPEPGGVVSDSAFTCIEATCPIDSVLWALDYGLNGRQDCGVGRVILRSGVIGTMRREALWADRDSFVAGMIAQYPRDRWTTRVNNRLVQAEIYSSFVQGIGSRAAYLADANYRAAALTGLANRATKSERHRACWGEAPPSGGGCAGGLCGDLDMGGQMNQTIGSIDFPFRQSNRIMFQHPGQQTVSPGMASPFPVNGAANNSSADQHTEIFLRGLHSYIRACNTLALKTTLLNVPAWKVYDQ